jgi:hypothetical protein
MKKSITRISLVSVTLIIILIQPQLVFAKFGGTLQNDQPWTLELTWATGNTEKTAMTVTYVDAKGGQDLDLFTIPASVSSFVGYSGSNIAPRTKRIIIDLDLPANGLAQIRILQGTTIITVDCIDQNGSGARVVFDVV